MSGSHAHHHLHHGRANGDAPVDERPTVKDPVCGMSTDPATSKHRSDHQGHTFHFCSAHCREKFVADPGKYLEPEPAAPPAPVKGTIYTCPMHPEVRQ